MMMVTWRHVAAAILGILVAVLLVVWSGIIGIGASSGHWAVTDWFLHWAMRSSVRTAALGREAPDLSNPELLPAAAGHFEAGCAVCHGSPAERRPAPASNMLPVPPDLAETVDTWTKEELFEIVKHGVRFTGMPAWPTQARDDEVWSMVAFLRHYRELDEATYRQLAGYKRSGPPDFDNVLKRCNGCHAAGRLNDRNPVPRLQGQTAVYLFESLKAYAKGDRHSGIMQTAVDALDEATMRRLAEHYAQAGPSAQPSSDIAPGGNAEGAVLAARGTPDARVAACLACHERPGGDPNFPVLSGQSEHYLERQLALFAAEERGGTAYHHLMKKAAHALRPDEIAALASYFAGRTKGSRPR